MEGKGFFTKELQEALLDGRVDLVVHSLKDLPTEEPDGLEVVAIPERTNPADLLLAREGLLDPTPANPLGLPGGAVLGTSSLRRAAQALALVPRNRRSRPCAATFRPGSASSATASTTPFSSPPPVSDDSSSTSADLDVAELRPEVMLPAPGQGALAIEMPRRR